MVVPFQMVMFTLSLIADRLKLNTPWGIIIIYLGFGAGLAVFMFCGFVKSIPIEIEEAAMIDGCNPVRTFFSVVLPIMQPTYISVGILETMWIWNDFLLPYLVLDINKYKTISIAIQYMKGSYGRVDMGAIMAALCVRRGDGGTLRLPKQDVHDALTRYEFAAAAEGEDYVLSYRERGT